MTRATGVGRGKGGGPHRRPPQPPVDLSGTKTDHGGARAYNAHKCRCEDCQEWRRSYDRERMELVRRTEAYREREGKRK